jgi:hypothetical protein
MFSFAAVRSDQGGEQKSQPSLERRALALCTKPSAATETGMFSLKIYM